MKNKGLWIGVVIVVIAVAAVLALVNNSDKKDNNGADVSHSSSATTGAPTSTNPEDNAVATLNVTISDFNFTPGTIKVKTGDTVIWTNQDTTSHTVTADAKSSDAPDGPQIAKGETYSFTFKKAGTYTYHCSLHPHMRGTVIVE